MVLRDEIFLSQVGRRARHPQTAQQASATQVQAGIRLL